MLRVFSYNIRTDTRVDGINAFSSRAPFIKETFPAYQADLIGFQETMPHMRDWLIENFPAYTFCGMGRDADLMGESNVVAFRKERFELLSMDTFWLSDTPHQAGSRFFSDQSVCPRICTCVMLYDKQTKGVFRHYNTHLDHVGQMAQMQGMSLILNRISSDYAVWPLPVILSGDLNVLPDSPVVRSILSFSGCGEKLKDVTKDLDFTFHAYAPQKGGMKIDYIFTNLPCEKVICAKDEKEGLFLSDHYPVGAVLALEPLAGIKVV